MSKRVQWAQRTTGDELDHGDCANSHELDEHGLDRTAFSTLRDALTAHAEQDHPDPTPLPSEAEHELTPDHPSEPRPIDLPGIFVDPNECAGLPVGVRRADTTTTDDNDPRSPPNLPLPSTSGPPKSKRRSLANLFRRSRQSTHLRLPAPSPPAQNPRRKNGLSKGPSVLSALLSLHDLEDHSLPPTPGDRSRSSSISTGATPPSSRPLSWSRASTARPPAQRNAAGVFGALVATTGNISGAAAPTNSTLQPDIKRKGFKVSRYAGTAPSSPPGTGANSPRAPPPGKISLPPIQIDDSHGSSTVAHSPRHSPESHDEKSDAGLLSMSMSAPTTPSGIRRHFPYNIDLPTPRFPGLRKRTEGPESPHSFAESDGGYFIPQPASLLSGPFSEKQTETDNTPAGHAKDTRGSTSQDKKRKTRRTKAQVFITRHVAAIRARHTFLLRLARAMMMFGAPTHRLPSQLQATARVLDVSLSVVYLPDVMILAFDDPDTATSSVQLVRQGSSLDLSKLQDAYKVYWAVIHDDMSVDDASSALDELMLRPPLYSYWQLVLIGALCSAAICVNAFSGSFIDALISAPLGALLVAIQLQAARHELFSSVFEISIATLQSFLSAALASTGHFCFSAVASSSVVLILPGFIVLSGSLEIANRNIVSGSVRLCYAIAYSLFLGFGLAIGAQIYTRSSGLTIRGPEDYSCSASHNPDGAWWQRTPGPYWYFLSVPAYSLVLSLRQHAPVRLRTLGMLVLIACAGWTANHFSAQVFPGTNDIPSAVGAFTVGVLANLYGRVFRGNAFVVMITGILFQLPSGLGNGGLLTFANESASNQGSSVAYLSGFRTALQLVSVAIGLTVGLGVSLVVVHPILSRRRQGGIFSL